MRSSQKNALTADIVACSAENSAVITSFTQAIAVAAVLTSAINSNRAREKKVLVQPSLSHKKRKVSVYESKRRHTSPARCYLGLMLDAYMHSHRLTQRDLAEMIGAKEDAVSRWRLGKRNPKTKTVRKIAEALGIEEERIRAEIEKGLLPDVTGSEGKEKEETKEALSEHYPEVGRLEEVLPVHASV